MKKLHVLFICCILLKSTTIRAQKANYVDYVNTLMGTDSKNLVSNGNTYPADNRYINSIKLNGKIYSKNFFKHTDLIKGATIDLDMSPKPNKQRGITKSDFPYSLSNE